MFRKSAISPISLILIFLISTDLSILLDIPVFRQIMGFIFLSIIPGTLFLCILKPDKLCLTEMSVLSVGLSISFIMFIGILINTLYPLVGYRTPLSVISLVISLTVVLLILTVIAHLRGGYPFLAQKIDLRLDIHCKALYIIPILFLPMSVLGMHLMNTKDNNALLMALLFIIPAYVILISIWKNQIPEKAYPLIIFMISISLILLSGMRSNHIIGADAHMEYYIFQQTFSNEKWQILLLSTLDSCLSISILPAIYQSFLDIDSEHLFKILYPLLFSLSPLVVYIIAKEYLVDIYALFATLFFMSQNVFLGATASARTTIAILFVALSIMVLLKNGISIFEKRLLLIIFIFSCVVSHYSTTYIFFLSLLFVFIGMQIIYGIFANKKRSIPKMIGLDDKQNVMDSISIGDAPDPSGIYITKRMLVIFFVAIFIWYSQVISTTFDSGVGFILYSMRSLQDFFIIESRDEGLVSALGVGIEDLGVPSKITFVFNWLTILFIAIGVMITLFRYYQRVALPSRNVDDNFSLLRKRIDILFFSLALIFFAILATSVALPFVSKGYGIDRTYLLTTIILSSFFVLGGITVAESFRFRWKYLVVLMVLIPFFMCATGTMHQIFGSPRSINLNSEGVAFEMFYIYDQESIAIKWLNRSIDNSKLYSDNFDARMLLSQGFKKNALIHVNSIVDLIKTNGSIRDGYVYLRYCGVVNGKLYGKDGNWHNISEYRGQFFAKNLVYDNGGAQFFAPSIIG